MTGESKPGLPVLEGAGECTLRPATAAEIGSGLMGVKAVLSAQDGEDILGETRKLAPNSLALSSSMARCFCSFWTHNDQVRVRMYMVRAHLGLRLEHFLVHGELDRVHSRLGAQVVHAL